MSLKGKKKKAYFLVEISSECLLCIAAEFKERHFFIAFGGKTIKSTAD